MADLQRKRLGRTLHAIHLLSVYGLIPNSGVVAPGIVPGSDEDEGYQLARMTFFKETIRTIFRTDVTSNTYNVGRQPFMVQSFHGNISVPGGIINNISLSSFPLMTTLTVYNTNGTIRSQYPHAGNPQLR